MDSIADNAGMWGIFILGALLGAGLVYVLIVPRALSLGRREGFAVGIARGQAAGEPAPDHSTITLIGGPADGVEVRLPPGPCSQLGLRFLVMITRLGRLERHTYTIVQPHVAEHTPEEGDSE